MRFSQKYYEEVLWEAGNVIRVGASSTEALSVILGLAAFKVLMDNKEMHDYMLPNITWHEIGRTQVDIDKTITDAVNVLEKENDELDGFGLFTNYFQSLQIDSIYKIVQLLGRLDLMFYSDDEHVLRMILGKWTDNVILRYGRGLTITPGPLADLSMKLTEPIVGSVYDGTCGIGTMLVQAKNYADEQNGAIRLYGQDVDEYSHSLCLYNLLLHGILDAQIKSGNTLSDPGFTSSNNELQKFDYIYMVPPFGGKWDRNIAKNDQYGRFRYGTPSNRSSEMAFIQHAISSLSERGKAVIILTAGSLFRGGTEKEIRRALILEGVVEAVIALPAGLMPYTRIPVNILVLNKQKMISERNKVLFINAAEEYQDARGQNILREQDRQRIIDTFKTRDMQDKEFSKYVDLEELESNNWSLFPLHYFDLTQVETKFGLVKIDKDLYKQSLLPKVRLGEITEISRGIQPPRDSLREGEELTHKIINPADLGEEGIDFANLSKISLRRFKGLDRYTVQQGDIVISARSSDIKITVIPEVKEKIVISHNLLKIRVTGTDKIDPRFIKIFLESPMGQYYLIRNDRGAVMHVILPRDVEDVLIPVLPIVKQKQLVGKVEKAEQEKKGSIEKAERKQKQEYLNVYDELGMSGAIEFQEY